MARRGFLGITPKEICTRANNGGSIGIYNGLVYNITSYCVDVVMNLYL
jgi:hypothetical protein